MASTDNESMVRGTVRLRAWRGGDFSILNRLNAQAARPEAESVIFRRHGRYLDGVVGRDGEVFVIDADGVSLGVTRVRYTRWRGSVAYGVSWQVFPGRPAQELGIVAVRSVTEMLAARPIPRHVIVSMTASVEVDQIARAAGFEHIGDDWVYDLES